jgi:phosphoribosylanthranilate isomerase
MTKVKICGITNLEDALLSAKFGADALGFNFYEKSPRYVSPENACKIIEKLPKEILKVGVFVNEGLDKIIEIAHIAKLDALQLHGEETPEFARELKAKTHLEIIKAFRVSPEFKPEDVLQYETDAILLDAYNPKEHGGTGETFDWEIAKKVQEIFQKMYLAGGLKHENVANVVLSIKPFAVDACSGIESQKGKKDKIKLINFLTKAQFHRNLPEKIDSLFDLLKVFHPRLAMYIGEKSLTLLSAYLSGFQSALDYGNGSFNTNCFYSGEFDKWIGKKLGYGFPNTLGWSTHILRIVDGDEEKAVDLFFALLEEFKMEKESQ